MVPLRLRLLAAVSLLAFPSFAGIPSVTSVNPTSGPWTGGTAVTFFGANLDGIGSVDFGGVPVPVSFNDGTYIIAHTAQHPAGMVDITLFAPSGPLVLPAAFTFFTDAATPAPVISGINPSTAPTTGGTMVTVHGANFSGAALRCDGSAILPQVIDDATLRFRAPPHAAGPVPITVTNSAGSATIDLAYIAVPPGPPSATGITPNSGPASGGTGVTISGTNLFGAPEVIFGGTAGVPVSENDGLHLTTVTPTHAPGQVTVTVVHPNGNVDVPGGFTFGTSSGPPPSITGITPSSGPTAGGTPVAIDGQNLLDCALSFGGIVVAPSYNDGTTVRAYTPAHAAGMVDVTLANLTGSSTIAYTYVDTPPGPPTVSSMTPSSGPATGGTTVTVVGSNLLGASSLVFGETGVPVGPNDGTQFSTATPPHAPGSVAVKLIHPAAEIPVPGGFTFIGTSPPPLIARLLPSGGPPAGGNLISIKGAGLVDCRLTIDGLPVAPQSNDGATMDVVMPPHAVGPALLVLSKPEGTATASYTYLDTSAAPSALEVSPPSGPTAGGTPLAIHGQHLLGGTLDIDGILLVPTRHDDDLIETLTPAHPPGDTVVRLQKPASHSIGFYRYLPDAPSIDGITPDAASSDGGTLVIIRGAKLEGVAIEIDGIPVLPLSNDGSTIVLIAPAHVAGITTISLTTAGGTATASLLYVDPAVVERVFPDRGPTAGGQNVAILGQHLAGSSVTFEGLAAAVTFNDDTRVDVITPPHAACVCDVAVTRSGVATVRSGGYRFVVPASGDTPASPDPVTVIAGPAQITFASVGTGGTTTVTEIDPTSVPSLPQSYAIAGADLAFEISTTAAYTGPIVVAFRVDSVADPGLFATLRVLHGEEGRLVDRTILPPDTPAPDFASRTIYARLPSLSPIVIARQLTPPRRRSARH